jgi:hypothetical protein
MEGFYQSMAALEIEKVSRQSQNAAGTRRRFA